MPNTFQRGPRHTPQPLPHTQPHTGDGVDYAQIAGLISGLRDEIMKIMVPRPEVEQVWRQHTDEFTLIRAEQAEQWASIHAMEKLQASDARTNDGRLMTQRYAPAEKIVNWLATLAAMIVVTLLGAIFSLASSITVALIVHYTLH